MATFHHILARHGLRTATLAAALCALLFAGCTADTEIKQGAEGEFCNGLDDDCRAGTICIDFVCQATEAEDECQRICDSFEECGTMENNCQVACHNTIRQWGEEPTEDFTLCLTEDLTCDEIQSLDDPPQECYNRLSLSDERRDLCQEFVSAAGSCDAATDELRTQCRYMARTRSEEVWSDPDFTPACIARIEDGVCEDIVACLTDIFDLDTAP